MPITEEEDLSRLLADGAITAISFDTNIFDEKGGQLSAPALQAIGKLKHRKFGFVLSETVAKEITDHLVKSAEKAFAATRKALGDALAAFDVKNPSRDELLDIVSGGQTAAAAATRRFDEYVTETGCEIIDDPALANMRKVFDDYFAGNPPFGSGAKKNEFPDAIALSALEVEAERRNTHFLLVSKDGDWRKFCEQSERLHLLLELERALDLINAPSVILKETVQTWLEEGQDGRGEVQGYLSNEIERYDFSVTGNATSGEMEADAYGGELKEVIWPDRDEIDIIELGEEENGFTPVTLSFPMLLTVKVPIELSFSVWDSVDREAVGMGGRSVEVERDIDARAVLSIRLHGLGSEEPEIELAECEFEVDYEEIDLGDVDVFEEEDYDD
ncbi:hypothetical protein FHX14_005516 [Rhizobium sp. BK619]|uniref:PIN domain-containing protein n=1 Tax=Rhizobium sp. BK619 TaxID=2586989 RepID=UPI00161BD25D|nr:PIN domain-containing protein [Rhizobium sp. BK619]MBB3649282.1 hypothetical protein [Rhizobium sp. BK619]